MSPWRRFMNEARNNLRLNYHLLMEAVVCGVYLLIFLLFKLIRMIV